MDRPSKTALALVLIAAAGAAVAQYPVKPMRLVVGFPPGGSADPTTRIMGAAAREALERKRYLMAIGLMIACTAPVMREGPSVNKNSQAWSFTISSVFMFSRM